MNLPCHSFFRCWATPSWLTAGASLVFVAAASFLAIPQASAQDAGESARALIEKYKASLVVVSAVGDLETTTSGDPLPPQKQIRRTLGVTVDPSGLVVVSNYAIDASADLEGQRAKHDEKVVNIIEAKMKFTKVEISYGDSTKIPGRVVLQRPEQDLAFILPDAAIAKALDKQRFSFVDLSAFTTGVRQADQVVGLSRSSLAFEFMPTVLVGRVTGIYRGLDRTFFVTSVGTAHGVPVFALDGSPVGITVERIGKDGKRTGLLGTLSAGSVQLTAKLALDSAAKAPPAAPAPAPPAP